MFYDIIFHFPEKDVLSDIDLGDVWSAGDFEGLLGAGVSEDVALAFCLVRVLAFGRFFWLWGSVFTGLMLYPLVFLMHFCAAMREADGAFLGYAFLSCFRFPIGGVMPLTGSFISVIINLGAATMDW